MPKTNLAQSTTKKKMAYVRGMMAGGQAQQGKDPADLAPKYGVTEKTIQNWIRKPERMNVSADDLLGLNEEPATMAAHFDGDEYTEEELNRIKEFAAFVKANRK
jgi:hypothetical protein